MPDPIDLLIENLEAIATSIRVHSAATLPWASVRAIEQRAASARDALLRGDILPSDDATDEVLSDEPEIMRVAPIVDVGAPVEEEDVLDEATVVDEMLTPTRANLEDAQTFVIEDDSLPVADSYAVEDEPALQEEPELVVEGSDDLVFVDSDDELVEDDASDAALVSFTSDSPSYVSFDEPEPADEIEVDIKPARLPEPAAKQPSYVSYVTDDSDLVSDADQALGTEYVADEEEEVTLGSIPIPGSPPNLAEAVDEPSFSDVGEDALVTIDDEGSDLLGDLDDQGLSETHELDSFDLMPDITEEEPVLEDDEETLIHGLEDAPSSDMEEVADDPSSSRGVIASPAGAKAVSPRVTAGLYGNPAVPTIREGNDPVPKAAAVQLNAGGGGRMVGLDEEEEPIAIGSVGDYGEEEDDYDNGDGLSIAIQEYEVEEIEEEEEEEEELELEVEEPVRPPPPRGPTPEQIQAVFNQALEAAEKGQLQDAADLYSDVVDADPDHLDAHVGRGRLYLDLGDYTRAMSDFMVAEEIDESSPEPQVAIGDLYFHRKDYRKAVDYFNQALEMSPNHAMAHCRRGISHYYRKNYRDALVDLEKANKLDPNIPNISSFISMAKRKAKPAGKR